MRLSATEIKSAAPSIRWLCRSLGQLNWLRNVLSSNETAGCNTPSRCSAGRPFGFTRVLMGAGWICAPPEWIQALAHRMHFPIPFVCVGIRLRPVFSHEGRTAAEVRRLNLARMEKRRLVRQGVSSGKYMTTRHRMEHDIGRREARFVRHILFEAIRAIDALQAARTVLQREFCLWTQAEPAARNHFNAYLRIAGELCGLLAVRRG